MDPMSTIVGVGSFGFLHLGSLRKKMASSYKLRGIKLSLTLVALICMTLVIWAWEKTPLLTTFLPPSERFDVRLGMTSPGIPVETSLVTDSTDMHQQPSAEEDFRDVGTLADSVTEKAEQGLGIPPTGLSQISSSEMLNDDNDLKPVPSEKKEEDFRDVTEKAEQGLGIPPTGLSQISSSEMLKDDKDLKPVPSEKKECNYAKGKWVADSRRPLYSGFGCKQWLSAMWACRLTQRPDFAFENYRWQPETCEMPEFEGSKFLRRMQHKTIAFVGDSIGRQQFQSLMCMVTGGKESPEVEDVGREYGLVKRRGAIRPDGWVYRFPSTNTTILYYWSASLCELEPLNRTDPATSYAMHLDRPATFVSKYLNRFDALVLNTGHHWNRGKFNANRWRMYVGGAPNTDRKIAGIWNARNLTVYSVVKWLDSQILQIPRMKVFFRSLSPRHFVNGDWNSGGSCDSTTPLAGGSVVTQDGSGDPVVEGAAKGTRVKILDITALSKLRDEGHMSRFSKKSTEAAYDCLHWCLPGIPDTWNEILAAQI